MIAVAGWRTYLQEWREDRLAATRFIQYAAWVALPAQLMHRNRPSYVP